LKPPKTYPKVEEYKNLKQAGSFPLHESTKPGILDLDIHPLSENYVISGGKDSKAILFDRNEGRKVFTIEPFDSKKKPSVTVTRFVPG
jgi:WD40 repeat protein